MLNKERYFMNEAYKQAELAFDDGEIPVGAVVVCKGQIIAKAYNQTERLNDATAHAEMIALTSASNFLQSKYLDECTLYVTLEPCKMCQGAIEHAHVKKVVFGAADNRRKSMQPLFELEGGLMQDECQSLLNEFFERLRKD